MFGEGWAGVADLLSDPVISCKSLSKGAGLAGDQRGGGVGA